MMKEREKSKRATMKKEKAHERDKEARMHTHTDNTDLVQSCFCRQFGSWIGFAHDAESLFLEDEKKRGSSSQLEH